MSSQPKQPFSSKIDQSTRKCALLLFCNILDISSTTKNLLLLAWRAIHTKLLSPLVIRLVKLRYGELTVCYVYPIVCFISNAIANTSHEPFSKLFQLNNVRTTPACSCCLKWYWTDLCISFCEYNSLCPFMLGDKYLRMLVSKSWIPNCQRVLLWYFLKLRLRFGFLETTEASKALCCIFFGRLCFVSHSLPVKWSSSCCSSAQTFDALNPQQHITVEIVFISKDVLVEKRSLFVDQTLLFSSPGIKYSMQPMSWLTSNTGTQWRCSPCRTPRGVRPFCRGGTSAFSCSGRKTENISSLVSALQSKRSLFPMTMCYMLVVTLTIVSSALFLHHVDCVKVL